MVTQGSKLIPSSYNSEIHKTGQDWSIFLWNVNIHLFGEQLRENAANNHELLNPHILFPTWIPGEHTVFFFAVGCFLPHCHGYWLAHLGQWAAVRRWQQPGGLQLQTTLTGSTLKEVIVLWWQLFGYFTVFKKPASSCFPFLWFKSPEWTNHNDNEHRPKPADVLHVGTEPMKQ